MTRQFSTVAPATTTTGSLTSGATTVPLTSITGLPTTFPFTLVLDAGTGSAECVDVTSITTLTATIVRGTCGTTAVSHSSGATVTHMATGRDFQDVHNLLALDQTSVGVPAAGITGLASPTGFRNAIINGCGAVAQRGTTGAGATASTIAARTGPDCWLAYRAGFVAGLTWKQLTTADTLPSGFSNAIRIQRDSGQGSGNNPTLMQSIQSVDARRFQGRPVALTFWARCGANYSAAASALGAVLASGTGVDENFAAGSYTGTAGPISQNVTLTTSWQKFYLSAAALSGSLNELTTYFSFAPTGTAGANDYFDITGIQLEDGIYPSPFEFRPYLVEYGMCRARFRRFGNLIQSETLPVLNGGTAGGHVWFQTDDMRTQPTCVSTLLTNANFVTTTPGTGQWGLISVISWVTKTGTVTVAPTQTPFGTLLQIYGATLGSPPTQIQLGATTIIDLIADL
jgi:hypothetical protein